MSRISRKIADIVEDLDISIRAECACCGKEGSHYGDQYPEEYAKILIAEGWRYYRPSYNILCPDCVIEIDKKEK